MSAKKRRTPRPRPGQISSRASTMSPEEATADFTAQRARARQHRELDGADWKRFVTGDGYKNQALRRRVTAPISYKVTK